MKTTIAVLLFGVAPLLALGAAPLQKAPEKAPAAPQRAVTISLQRVANESTEGKAANEKLGALAKKMAADLQAKQRELQQTQSAGSPEARQAEWQRAVQQSQADFQNAQRQAQNELRTKLAPIVAEIAGQQKVELVLNADTAIVWSAPQLDITNDVLAKLNAAPAAAPSASAPPK